MGFSGSAVGQWEENGDTPSVFIHVRASMRDRLLSNLVYPVNPFGNSYLLICQQIFDFITKISLSSHITLIAHHFAMFLLNISQFALGIS